MEKIDFLFIGGIIPKGDEREVLKNAKSGIQLAANNFQWSLIKGFDRNLGKPVKILNTMFIGSYPRNYSRLIIKGSKFSHAPEASDYNLSFVNISVIKHFLCPFGQSKLLKQWARSNKDSRKVAFIYSTNPSFVRIARLLKKHNPNIRICISVNDLPEYTMLSKKGNSLFIRAWKTINSIRVVKGLRYIDGYMIVAKQIAEYLGIETKPHIVVEALIDTDEYLQDTQPIFEERIKKVVYTGSLTAKYGIRNLLEAFKLIESTDYRLVICGDGEMKEELTVASRLDSRIVYKGILSPKETQDVQRSATVLVNPRQRAEQFTKYSFPIKNAEYLMSGVPVICYKLEGIPEEYNEHLMYVDAESIEALKERIVEVCEMRFEERRLLGKLSQCFIIEQKNHVIQTKRILEMILPDYQIK